MAKDPAFLFYPSDFLTGTIFFSLEDLGLFIRLLCIQHQHEGRIKKYDFNQICSEKYQRVREKFIEDDNGFYNKRLDLEIAKRKRDADASRINGLKGGRPKTKSKPKNNLNKTHRLKNNNLTVNENINENINENEVEFEKNFELIFPFQSDNFLNVWQQFIDFRKSINKPLKKISQQAQLKKLSTYSENDATEMLLQSIANGWQGVFELKNNNNNGKQKSKLDELREAIRQSDAEIAAKYSRQQF